MKIERLINIIIILMQNKKVTATYLAEKYDVSKRTIYRDITDLSLAGLPIVTLPGTKGGIMLDESYKIDKTLFTQKDFQAILSGLLGLDSISYDNQYKKIIDKFFGTQNTYLDHHVLIDLSSHYKETLAPKIQMIQEAIEQSRYIEFEYFNARGQRTLCIEPYLVVFQWSAWYVFGYYQEDEQFRLYKLNRLWNINVLEDTFRWREIPSKQLEFNNYFTNKIQAVILFDQSAEYRIIEEYGLDYYNKQGDGQLYFECPFTNEDYLIEWVLSFGDKAELIKPESIRKKISEEAKKLMKKYL